MTTFEPPLPVPEDDALALAASAVVDGVASAEEAAMVAADPDGATRTASLRDVARAVGSPPPAQEPAAAARALAAALAASDPGLPELDDSQGPSKTGEAKERSAAVTGLRPMPPPLGSARRFPRPAAVAAALLLLVGIGVFSVAILRSGDDATNTFTAAAPARENDNSPSYQAGKAGEAANPTATARSAAPVVPPSAGPATAIAPAAGPAGPPPVVDGGDLGRQDDIGALIRQVAAALDGDPGAASTTPRAALPKDVQACADAGSGETGGPLRYRAVGNYKGTPAVILAYDPSAAQQPRMLRVLARSGCTALASGQLG